MTQLRTWTLAATALFGVVAACSPTVSTPIDDGNSGGSGNQQQGAGGSNLPLGSGGTVVSGAGGNTGTPGAGGALITPGAGGAPITPGAGGAGDTGPVCGEPESFIITKGYVNNGEICGHAWTATNGEGETIEPPCGDAGACFTDDTICASGTIPANDPDANSYTGIMIGINAQSSADAETETTWSASGSLGMTWTAGGATGEARLLIQTAGGDYCVANAKSGSTYGISEFVKECWEGGDQSPALTAATAVKAIALQINGEDTAQTFTDLCITKVTND